MPTYNEAANIEKIVRLVFQQQAALRPHELHVLVVDDLSPDGTADRVRSLMEEFTALHLLLNEKRGIGEACKKGFAHAAETIRPEYIVQMDADLQHDPAAIPHFLELARSGFDVVIGSRFASGGTRPEFSLRRRILSSLGNWLIRTIGGVPGIRDCTSGFRCLRADLVQKCDLSRFRTRGYSLYSSLLIELLRNGARVVEVPIAFKTRRRGSSKLRLRDQLEFLRNILAIRGARRRVRGR